VAQFDCDVNARGLRTQIVEAVRQPDTTLATDLVEYEYDLLGRLTSEKRTRGAQVLVDKEYSYDLVGNRVQVINSGTPQDATFNDLHQLETDGNLSFTYDASGNLYEKKQQIPGTPY
jgi:YD repeat-containing protein